MSNAGLIWGFWYHILRMRHCFPGVIFCEKKKFLAKHHKIQPLTKTFPQHISASTPRRTRFLSCVHDCHNLMPFNAYARMSYRYQKGLKKKPPRYARKPVFWGCQKWQSGTFSFRWRLSEVKSLVRTRNIHLNFVWTTGVFLEIHLVPKNFSSLRSVVHRGAKWGFLAKLDGQISFKK